MSTVFSKEQLSIMRKIIYAVETGGQTYGNQRYDDFTESGANCSNEKAITIGAGQWYAGEAKQLLAFIKEKYPSVFKKYDTAKLSKDLSKSWATYAISKSSSKAKVIVSIINSKEGKECQDLFMEKQISDYAELIQKKYGDMNNGAIAECINIYHQGGEPALTRILKKTKKPYTAHSIKNALDTDPKDKSSNNQVGDFTKRQDKVYSMICNYLLDKKESEGDTMAKIKIGHATHDERGKYRDGKAGDQGNTEVFICDWYNRPWTHVIRFKDKEMSEKVAYAMERACKNDNIGYDMNQRNTALSYAKKVTPKYDPGKIKDKCETDCSALVSICCMYAGVSESVLYKEGNSSVTSNIRARLNGTGLVTVYTDSKYCKGWDYLKRGDILLCEGHHVAVALENGSKATTTSTATKPKNDSGDKVEIIAESANVRTAPGEKSPLCKSDELKPLKKGEVVKVVGTGESSYGTKLWYLIEKSGKRGYVSSKLVKKK